MTSIEGLWASADAVEASSELSPPHPSAIVETPMVAVKSSRAANGSRDAIEIGATIEIEASTLTLPTDVATETPTLIIELQESPEATTRGPHVEERSKGSNPSLAKRLHTYEMEVMPGLGFFDISENMISVALKVQLYLRDEILAKDRLGYQLSEAKEKKAKTAYELKVA
ncbi:hypothetical protein ZIOFF_015980 [Zingiber officinale]|uniref:Uncharacterized protein n=1 Tax=Zingiber officinale TaxID=94328 RepID=A0A8J5LWY7_ZINOF|nr:hypothetical protein ZIOFF_015980 [Zingiber officinale]